MADILTHVENDKVVIPITPDPSRVRMEIDELLADNAMTNLYLLAMEAMQMENPKRSGDTENRWTFYSLSSETTLLMPILSLALTTLPRHSWSACGKLERHFGRGAKQIQLGLLHAWVCSFPNVASSLHLYV